jgi:nucleoside-diphosphate-sugar epimerase
MGRATEFIRVNTDATRRLAISARRADVKRFVFLGSVAVVGPTGRASVDERASPSPDSDYGRSKLGAERELAAVLNGSGTAWSVLRAPLVFGPGNPGNMARLLRLVQRGWPLPFGAIDNIRSFLYVDNLIDAIVKTLRIVPPLTGVYFVDDGTVLSTGNLCRAIAEAADLKPRIFRMPPSYLRLLGVAGDVAERITRRDMPLNSYSVDRLMGSSVVDGSKFRQATGWEPPVATDEAIRRTVHSVIAPAAAP